VEPALSDLVAYGKFVNGKLGYSSMIQNKDLSQSIWGGTLPDFVTLSAEFTNCYDQN
jgi:hypothetical protein